MLLKVAIVVKDVNGFFSSFSFRVYTTQYNTTRHHWIRGKTDIHSLFFQPREKKKRMTIVTRDRPPSFSQAHAWFSVREGILMPPCPIYHTECY